MDLYLWLSALPCVLKPAEGNFRLELHDTSDMHVDSCLLTICQWTPASEDASIALSRPRSPDARRSYQKDTVNGAYAYLLSCVYSHLRVERAHKRTGRGDSPIATPPSLLSLPFVLNSVPALRLTISTFLGGLPSVPFSFSSNIWIP